MWSVVELAEQLRAGRITARELVEDCLSRIADPAGEGSRTFLKVFADAARIEADAVDRLRAAGAGLPALAGVPVSVKDLFDIAGQTTTAGTRVLASRPAASADARVVARLKAAGMIVLGRTNMTELAYSGLGINPHYGTPLNPFERASARIPGGSSSGAAVSITDRMAAAALGTDTGGSCRIPAALTGIVGLKPTRARVPLTGVVPLSTTLDSVGPLAATVECCALIDAVIAGGEPAIPEPYPVQGLRLLVPQRYVFESIEPYVADSFERALAALSQAGAHVLRAPLSELERLPEINALGGFSAAETYAEYGALIERDTAAFDPRVATRVLKGREQSAADYLQLMRARTDLITRLGALTRGYDAVVMPTVPIVAPRLADLESDAAYFRANGLTLRNPAIANFLDRCAISVPIHRAGEAPVGLMLMCDNGADERLLAIARTLQGLLSPPRQ